MFAAKDWILGLGVFTAFLGLMCVPLGEQATPKRVLSIFARSADAGAFLPVAGMLLAAGAAVICLSFLIPRR